MSRILDSYIAEHVMGLPTQEQADSNPNNLNAGHQIQIKKYSTDMNAAMEVANKFDVIIIDNLPINLVAIECIWDVAIMHQKKDYWVTHDSLPTAICLAALRAVGKDDLVDEYLGGEG